MLEVRNLKVTGDAGHTAVNDANLAVRQGEILGVAGEAGNGQKELVEAIYGLRKIEGGRVFLKGKDMTNATPREMFANRLRYIPEEGFPRGGCSNLSIADNSILNRYRYAPFSSHQILNRAERDRFATQVMERFDVRAQDFRKPLRHLSGGNIQKVIVGRELSGEFDVLIAFHCTSGLDARTTSMIREQIADLRRKGKAILLVDEDLNEIMAMSDRIVVMSRGRIVADKNRNETTMMELGAIIAGLQP